MSSCPIFYCDPHEDKIVYIIRSRRSFCTSSRSSISGLGTKRLTSTLNDIIYYTIFDPLSNYTWLIMLVVVPVGYCC
jgi:hypothetical protein